MSGRRRQCLQAMCGLIVITLVDVSAQSGPAAQGQGPGGVAQGTVIRTEAQQLQPEKKEVVPIAGGGTAEAVAIRVDHTGVASWKYRNARNPPWIWDRSNPESFRLIFVNATSGATVRITLPPVAVPFISQARPDNRPFNPASLLGLDVRGARGEARRLVNLSLAAAESAINASTGEEGAAREQVTCIAQAISRNALANEKQLDGFINALDRPGATAKPEALPLAIQTVTKSIVDVRALLEIRAPSPAATPSTTCQLAQAGRLREALVAYRAAVGVRAQARASLSLEAAIVALEQALGAVDEFANLVQEASQSAAQPATVRVPPPTAAQRAELTFGTTFSDCQAADGKVTCTPTLTLAPNAEGWIEGRLLNAYPAKGVVKFRVSFPFALESEQPADPNGYFSLDKELTASPTTATWTASGSLSFVRDPFYGPTGQLVDDERRYEGKDTQQFRGTARTALSYSLGNRASGLVELQFKNGIHGRKDEDLAVKVNQYNFQAFGFTGTSLKFGKYLFAAPTDGLAINETGEGGTIRYRWFGLSHILKREGADGAADPDDNDHKVWLFDVSNLAIRTRSLRSASFYSVYGMDDTPGRERRYFTVGGEVFFGIPRALLTGTLAYYRSESNPDQGSAVRPAEGSSWLGRVSKSWFEASKPARTFSVTLAGGSGDDRNTTDRYEGYLGETAGFSPDGSHFLGGVSPRLQLEPVTLFVVDKDGNLVLDANGNPKAEFVDKGLSNRTFLGLTFSDQTFSPLDWIVDALQIPVIDVESRQTTVRLHRYAPTEQVLGTRAASWEGQIELLLESPKGVKYIIKYTHVFARGPLEALFPKEPWVFLAQCNISLK